MCVRVCLSGGGKGAVLSACVRVSVCVLGVGGLGKRGLVFMCVCMRVVGGLGERVVKFHVRKLFIVAVGKTYSN